MSENLITLTGQPSPMKTERGLTKASSRDKSLSVSDFTHSWKNSSFSLALSGSWLCSRLKFSRDVGSMISFQIFLRISLYLSKMVSSARPWWIPIRASKRLPTSAMPPVKPRPPLARVSNRILWAEKQEFTKDYKHAPHQQQARPVPRESSENTAAASCTG